MSRRLLLLATLFVASLLPSRVFAQAADVIRGRVIGPDSVAVEGVRVSATSLSGNVTRQARTGKDGRYTITFPGGDGDYMVSFAALGFAARRFEIKRVADEEILVADAKLARAAQVLGAVQVDAPRQLIDRNSTTPDVGGTEQNVGGQALPAADLGDLAAMAATLPGVTLVPGENGDPNGFSVLGLGADQNNTTLNGMNFGGSNLPRDAGVSTSLVTSPYDVSRGGFSGGQLNIRTRPGSNFSSRGMSLNLDAPQLQWTDQAAAALGQEYSNVSLGGMLSGPLVLDKMFYNMAYQLGRRGNDFQSLLNTGPLGLQTAGVARDSVTRLLNVLGTLNVPTIVGGIPSSRQSDQGSVFGSVDFAPPGSTSGQAFNLSYNGGWNHLNPLFSQATALPSSSGDRTSYNGGVQGRHTGYFKGLFSETSLNLSGSHAASEPYLLLPSGRVRVNSTFADGSNGVSSLAFGGNSFLNSNSRNTSLGALNQLSWFSTNNKHRLKLTSELRRDDYEQESSNNLFGTFTYNSLADLAASRPSSFSRSLSPRRSGSGQVIAGASLGDAYRRSSDFQLQYGVRLDGNRFLDQPTLNPNVQQAFGVANNTAPNKLYVSPRVGFSWTIGKAAQISGFDGAARSPRAVVRGGIGIFQNTPGTQSISGALDNTGLPSAVQQLTCVGNATPVPAWDQYLLNPSAVPSSCANGGSPVFANSAPNVTLFAPDWSAPRSVRSNLQWSGPALRNRFSTAVEVTYSDNLQQQGALDLNFAPTQRFSLTDEGGRPVYVQPGSIVPATGSIASSDARVSPLFARVNEMKSDLRSQSRQVRFSLAPMSFSTSWSWNASYVYSNVRELVRGFSGTTTGNPLDVEWARSSFDARHQIVYSLGYNFFDAVRLNWFGQFRSGTPFTPMVAGDVNGDGWSNDRAFIFNPAQSGDPALSSAMQSLLGSGSNAARACLSSQLGKLSQRNSCEGPWTSTATLSINFNPAKIRMPQRASLSFQLSNPIGAADLLLHGSSGLRGWGQPANPDNALLYVRGFDPVNKRYQYEVNQRFGATDPARSTFRLPTTLTAMLRMDIGPTRERQMLSQQLDRGRRTQGQKLPEPILRAMFNGGGLPNPMATILRQQDSLKLTAQQADSIATLNRWYVTRSDSIWAPVARYLGGLPDQYDQGDAYDRYISARKASVDLLMKIGPEVKGLLSADQQRRLPAFIAGFLEPRYLASIRSGTVTFTGGMFPGVGAAQGGGNAVFVGGGGGGERTVIIRQ